MKKITDNKKKKSILQKVGIGFGGLLGVAIVAALVYWFSMPAEARNMVSFMMFSSDSYENHEEYQVVERNDHALEPSAYDMTGAESEASDENVNIGTVTEMVKNEESSMFKIGMVKRAGLEDYTGWQLLADEGAEEGEYPFGPSPLSYYTAGLASNLHTQILMAAQWEGIVLDDVKVEVVNDFYWDEMMADDGNGNLGLSSVNIIIESDAPDEVIESIKERAINGWASGQALMNEITVIPNLITDGDNWESYKAVPGTSSSEVSYDGDVIMSSVTDEIQYPQYTDLWEEEEESLLVNMDTMNNLTFQIYAIAENMNNTDRPYYQSVTISSPSGETWEMYADEFMGENDKPLAPTPLEYFTVGTSLCLTSQTTLVNAMMDLDSTDYRVEHFFEYSQNDVGTNDVKASLDTVYTYVFIDADESQETLDTFLSKSLALCFAGEGLVNETEMDINLYVNGDLK
jgi:uncharacterized OsmC-like protein